MMRAESRWRDLLSCAALANLVMMKVWLQLLPSRPGRDLWLAHSPANAYVAAMLGTLALGLGLWCVVLLAGRWRWTAVATWPVLHALTLCFALNGIRSNYDWSLGTVFMAFGPAGAMLVGLGLLAALAVIVFVFVRTRHAITRQHHVVSLLCVPFMVVTFGQSLAALGHVEPEAAFLPHVRRDGVRALKAPAIPVVWIVFDELDYGIAFERRPRDLSLPVLDSLRSTSVFATHAQSPGATTSVSVPALLTGEMLRRTEPLGARDMRLVAADGSTRNLATASTILDDMHERGFRTALFGWYFPYARLFGNVDVVEDFPTQLYADYDGLFVTLVMQLRSLVETLYYSPFGESTAIRHHIAITTGMQRDVIHYLRDGRNGGFVFLHYPVPHSLNIYDRRTRTFGANRSVQGGYVDNLALVDRLLGEVRGTMEQAGTWDDALVVVSSDHHLRVNTFDHVIERQRVPFMVKLPHESAGMTVDAHCETVITRELVLQVVDGRLTTPAQVAGWLAARSAGQR
jgi:hypothetical protein